MTPPGSDAPTTTNEAAAVKRPAYMNDDGEEIAIPVSDYTIAEARHEAASTAAEMTNDPWMRTRYIGKNPRALHDHDDYEACFTCPPEPAWCFELYEGTYRRRPRNGGSP